MNDETKKSFRIFIILYFVFLVIALAILAIGIFLFNSSNRKQSAENREIISGLRQGAVALEKSFADLNSKFDNFQAAIGNLEKSIAANTKRIDGIAGGNKKSITANQEIIQRIENIQNAFQSFTIEVAASENIGADIRMEVAAIRAQLKNSLDGDGR